MYWVIVYLRWQDAAGWEHINESVFANLPSLAKLFVPNMIRKYMLKQLNHQGMGRHSKDEVLQLGIKLLESLTTLLGEKKYFFGDKATSIDASAFAFLANVIYSPLKDPFKNFALEQNNLVAYCGRMWDDYYPELRKPNA